MKIQQEELSIYEVEKLYKDLEETLEEDDVVIDISAVKKVDMSIIQLLVSTQKTCKAQEKSFELQGVSSEVQSILSECACEFLIGVADG